VVVPGPDRQTLHANLRGIPDLDLTLDVLDQTGARLIGINDGKASEPETLTGITLSPGTYFVRVRELLTKEPPKTSGEQSYALTWKLTPFDPSGEAELNDKAALATPLALDKDFWGQLGWRRDEDYWKVALTGGGSPDAGATPGQPAAAPPNALRVDVSGVDDVALTVQVLDSIGGKLLDRKGGKGEPVTLRNVGVRAGEPFYFVVVSGVGRNVEGHYTLHVSAEKAQAGPVEQEPNDDKSHATPIAAGTAVSGFLSVGDQDYFKLTSAAPQIVRIEVSCPERVNIKLALHDAQGAELYHVDEAGRQEPELIADAYVPAGDAYIRVYAGKGESNADQPYRLEVKATPDDGAWEHEPNGSAARATPWAAGVSAMRGMIQPKGDEDLYRITPGGHTLSAQVRAIERVNLEVVLLDDQQKPVAKAVGTGDEPRSLRAAVDPARTYFLRLRDARGKESNPRDAYELHVTYEP
jgi:hypothetical protein